MKVTVGHCLADRLSRQRWCLGALFHFSNRGVGTQVGNRDALADMGCVIHEVFGMSYRRFGADLLDQ
jgi:hypothetical protein